MAKYFGNIFTTQLWGRWMNPFWKDIIYFLSGLVQPPTSSIRFFFEVLEISQWLIVGLGPGCLDSERILENGRDCYLRAEGTLIKSQTTGPQNQQLTMSWWTKQANMPKTSYVFFESQHFLVVLFLHLADGICFPGRWTHERRRPVPCRMKRRKRWVVPTDLTSLGGKTQDPWMYRFSLWGTLGIWPSWWAKIRRKFPQNSTKNGAVFRTCKPLKVSLLVRPTNCHGMIR